MIQEYISFGIQNGYQGLYPIFEIDSQGWIKLYDEEYPELHFSSTHFLILITSKEFIEAIARGIYKEELDSEGEIIPISFYELDITYKQAVAIRDNTLEDCIKEILPNK